MINTRRNEGFCITGFSLTRASYGYDRGNPSRVLENCSSTNGKIDAVCSIASNLVSYGGLAPYSLYEASSALEGFVFMFGTFQRGGCVIENPPNFSHPFLFILQVISSAHSNSLNLSSKSMQIFVTKLS
jgi:hypothetical protein